MSDREATRSELERELGLLRKRIGELEESETHYRDIVENQPGFFLRFLPDLRITFANRRYCTCFRTVVQRVQGDNVLRRVHPQDRERMKEEILSIGIDNPFKTINCKILDSGDVRWHQWIVRAVFSEHGEPMEYYAVGRDSTEEKDLEKLWHMYEFTANASEELAALIDTDYTHAVVNEAYCRAHGRGRSEIVGRSVQDVWGSGQFPEVLKSCLNQCFQGDELHTEEWLCLNGKVPGCYDVACYPYRNDKGEVTHAVLVSRDITAPKLAEKALRESEERFRFLAEKTGDVIYRLKYDSMVYDYLSPAIFKLTGYSSEEIDALKFSKLVRKIEVPGEPDVSADVLIRNRENGRTGEYQADYLIETKSGGLKWLRDHSFPWYDESGVVLGSVGILTDVSQRKKAEEALGESERRFRNMSELSPFPICIVNRSENITYLNQRFTDLFGYTIDDIPTTLEWLKKACPNPIERQAMADAFKHETASREHEIVTRDHRVKCRDDSIRDIRFRVVSMENGDTFVTAEDMTDHKKMQEERIKSGKLESIAVLAGGIAHDFNNILTAVVGNISLAKIYGCPNERASEKLTEAERACLRAKNLTQQLLTFSRGGEPIKKITSLPRFLSETVHFILGGSNIRPEFSIPEDLWYVECDEGQIGQVFNNLIINAKQAMPEGGMIEIAAENVELDSEEKVLPLKAGMYIEISVRDQGHGIPEKSLTRIFDPYYTTKHTGSGLGLATAYSIVKKHQGYIGVESVVGAGSCFHVYLPAIDQSRLEKTAMAGGGLRGQGRILVIDDEEVILNCTYDLLRHLGYEAELARDGREALELYQEAMGLGRPFDAIIMDLTMPGGMGGSETFRRLHEIDPEVKAIVSSGYSNDPIMARYEEHGFCGVLYKPYEAREMGDLLRKIIKYRRMPLY